MTLFQYGKLTESDVAMAAMSLQAYSVGLLAFMLIKVLAPGYFSRQDTKTPVRIGIIAMAANMVFNIALVVPLHFYWQVGHIGLALATSLSAILNAGLLYLGLYRQKVYSPMPGFVAVCIRLSMAALAMAAVLSVLVPEQAMWVGWLWWQRAWHLLLLCGAGAMSYFAALLLSGARLRHFRADSSTLA
jgi:putative peptidoglycan lipid II flippase